MAFNEQDRRFLTKASEHVGDPIFPGLVEGIGRLDKEGVGRAIISERPNEAGVMVRREIGYILPLNREQSRHVVFFVNGSICVTEASTKETKDRETYSARMKANKIPIKSPSDIPLVDLSQAWLDGNSWMKCKVVTRNDTEESVPEINKAVGEAILCAFELRDERQVEAQASVAATAAELVKKLDVIFENTSEGE